MSKSMVKIVLYDGSCGFCHFSVRFIFRWEKQNNQPIMFASLNSAKSQQMLADMGFSNLPDSFVFIEGSRLHLKSNAFIALCKYFRSPINYFAVLRIFPLSLRDWVYDLIAKYRKKIAGEKNECDLPDEGMRERML